MKDLISKIVKVQSELEVPKTQKNSFGGYMYRSCEDILEKVKPLLIEQGLLQTLSDEVVEINGKNYVKATVEVTEGEDSRSVTAFAREAQSKKGMDDSQMTGTASSYARKYALNGMWNIDDVKDADSGAHHTNGKSNGKAKSKSNGSKASKDDDKDWLNKTKYKSDEITDAWKKAKKYVQENPEKGLKSILAKYKVNKANYRELHKGNKPKDEKKMSSATDLTGMEDEDDGLPF